jgi:hypothetical protein
MAVDVKWMNEVAERFWPRPVAEQHVDLTQREMLTAYVNESMRPLAFLRFPVPKEDDVEKEYWFVIEHPYRVCSTWTSEAEAVNEAKARALREPGKGFLLAHVSSYFVAGGVQETMLGKR